jgi:hypothetical protein
LYEPVTRRLAFFLCLTAVPAFIYAGFSPAAEERLTHSREVIEKIKSDTELALRNLTPNKSANRPTLTMLPGDGCALWGNLFNDGNLWAIFDVRVTGTPEGIKLLSKPPVKGSRN